MNRSLRLLLVEDSEEDAELLLYEVRKGGYEPSFSRVFTADALKEALAGDEWDVVISDYTMPQFSGLEALKIVHRSFPDMPFIINSGNIGEDIAVGAMHAGAHDYVMKSNLSRLVPAIERELREASLRRESRRAELELLENEARFRAIVSNVPGVVFRLLHEWQQLPCASGFARLLRRQPIVTPNAVHVPVQEATVIGLQGVEAAIGRDVREGQHQSPAQGPNTLLQRPMQRLRAAEFVPMREADDHHRRPGNFAGKAMAEGCPHISIFPGRKIARQDFDGRERTSGGHVRVILERGPASRAAAARKLPASA
jgi:CheY-like chemotaxis protein